MCHKLLRFFLFLSCPGGVAGRKPFYGPGLSPPLDPPPLHEDPLRFQEVINAGSHVFLTHLINSFWRLRANAKSSSGVALVFLMKPWSATKCSWHKHNRTRAVRFVGKSVRISQTPP